MPNIIIETSRNELIPQVDTLLARINDTLWQSGHFAQSVDIKTRYYTADNCLIGLASGNTDDFIFVHFYLMAGRDSDTVKALCQSIVTAITSHLAAFKSPTNGQLQICVNPMVLSPEYCKVII